MERIGIYSGTFNPVHLGHFRGAQYACRALGLDRLLMIPDRIAPHKQLGQGAPTPEQRLEMIRLGLAADGAVEASPIALEREGTSYTWHTVEQVRASYPDAKLYLLLGSDMFPELINWWECGKIIAHASLAVLCRSDGEDAQAVSQAKEQLEAMGAEVTVLDNPVTDISSTQLRRMLVFRGASEFLPDAVARYIYDQGLYGTGCDLRGLPIEQLEAVVVKLLKPGRVAHVLGCRQAAVELARKHGADETDAARAALLHDITKALDGRLQLTLCHSYGIILDEFSSKNPKTLHALTGSLVAERIFGENEAVVQAIRCHTTGKADMNLLEKIIYVADYMEPNRDFPGVETLRSLAYADITQALKLGLEMTLDMLRRQGREISPGSQEALAFLERAGEERKIL